VFTFTNNVMWNAIFFTRKAIFVTRNAKFFTRTVWQ